jgi:hypothetical protein
MEKKTFALIEAEATRKNHRHPTGVLKNEEKWLHDHSVAMASVNAK